MPSEVGSVLVILQLGKLKVQGLTCCSEIISGGQDRRKLLLTLYKNSLYSWGFCSSNYLFCNSPRSMALPSTIVCPPCGCHLSGISNSTQPPQPTGHEVMSILRGSTKVDGGGSQTWELQVCPSPLPACPPPQQSASCLDTKQGTPCAQKARSWDSPRPVPHPSNPLSSRPQRPSSGLPCQCFPTGLELPSG